MAAERRGQGDRRGNKAGKGFERHACRTRAREGDLKKKSYCNVAGRLIKKGFCFYDLQS